MNKRIDNELVFLHPCYTRDNFWVFVLIIIYGYCNKLPRNYNKYYMCMYMWRLILPMKNKCQQMLLIEEDNDCSKSSSPQIDLPTLGSNLIVV